MLEALATPKSLCHGTMGQAPIVHLCGHRTRTTLSRGARIESGARWQALPNAVREDLSGYLYWSSRQAVGWQSAIDGWPAPFGQGSSLFRHSPGIVQGSAQQHLDLGVGAPELVGRPPS